ncbi:Uma2 family endonuclease [Oscillatoria salina]|uniref:Uma2 family endonuclease n=1 Tax=Oscillatoria salina TaxID=331517 RepID=UPI0013B5FBD5|nr:Uma2 family endonuclease [Oscillatoria salina]MBZ8183042.1 Uma2 family endonuclease [Oscillatoria salina IIICB1]NET86597.1 Uma2 family endonuclease [Kamptonema sp. SIO1D9]
MTTVLNLDPITKLTVSQFYQLCLANPDLLLERSPTGELIIVTPLGGESGSQQANLIASVVIWNRQTKLGIAFSSQTIFSLPGSGSRAPDASWVELSRWEALSEEERSGFPPICPDFLIELRSKSDRLQPLQAKMQEYLRSGLRLGWLINPQDRQVEIYRQMQDVEVVETPVILSGEDVLPGFSLEIAF